MQKIEVEIQIFFWFSLVLRIDRRGEMWLMFANVVHFHWKELLSAAYIGSIVLLLTAFAVFLLEQGLDDETSYETMGDALWWVFITLGINMIIMINITQVGLHHLLQRRLWRYLADHVGWQVGRLLLLRLRHGHVQLAQVAPCIII